MILPPYLNTGDTIGIACPARFIDNEPLSEAIGIITQMGFKVKLCSNINARYNQLCGTDAERSNGFNELLADTSVKAIIVARGGYGCVRIVDVINWNILAQNPKWIVGYSDVTVLHSHIHQTLNMATLHAEMPVNFGKTNYKANVELLHNALLGKHTAYNWQHHASINGTCNGVLVGGNLSILYSMAGSVSDINTNDKILFIEDLDEYLYHIDRMMYQLVRNNKFNKVKGVVIGSMIDMKDNAIPFGSSAVDIITQHLQVLNIPIAFGAPFGHQANNYPLVFGQVYELAINNSEISFGINHTIIS
jgi:muramoyltetrapeptide carboxypeptidase